MIKLDATSEKNSLNVFELLYFKVFICSVNFKLGNYAPFSQYLVIDIVFQFRMRLSPTLSPGELEYLIHPRRSSQIVPYLSDKVL